MLYDMFYVEFNDKCYVLFLCFYQIIYMCSILCILNEIP
jgi:hypothetical protein